MQFKLFILTNDIHSYLGLQSMGFLHIHFPSVDIMYRSGYKFFHFYTGMSSAWCVNMKVLERKGHSCWSQNMHRTHVYILQTLCLMTWLTRWWWRCHRWDPVQAGRRCSVAHCSRTGFLRTVSSWVGPLWRWSTCLPARSGLLCRSYRPAPPASTPSYRSRVPLRFPSRRRRWKDPRHKPRWSEALKEKEKKRG